MTPDSTPADVAATVSAAEPPRPITRRSLHDEIVTRVRDMIIEGALAPGARIHEGQLGQQLGVSRTPLREALKFLASEGLIELVPNRGAVVRSFTPKDVRDMLDVLAVLESFAARLACRNASSVEIAEVRALHDRMTERYHVRDRLEYFKLNQQIHSAFLRLSGNATLEAAHAAIQSRLKRIRYIGNREPQQWQDAMAEHQAMIGALEARDGEALARIVTKHMEGTWKRVKATL
ncbi:MAG: GntR family transcriptional regulator [Betaproteobacteria bacterium]